ncbi:MAG: hypothetical protein HQL99_11365 [Magnetococcales bacterium]|nr:hypothetical protein [Magnetococcales bacterium]
MGDRVSVRDGRAVRVQEAVEVPVFFVCKEVCVGLNPLPGNPTRHIK